MTKILLFLGVLLSTEIYLIGQVMDTLGVLTTLLVLVTTAMLGSRLVKQAGVATLQKMAAKLQAGSAAGQDLVEGGVLLIAGFLFIFPGFLSDVLALFLLLPPVRRWTAIFLVASLHPSDLPVHADLSNPGYTVINGEATREADAPTPPPLSLPPPDNRPTRQDHC